MVFRDSFEHHQTDGRGRLLCVGLSSEAIATYGTYFEETDPPPYILEAAPTWAEALAQPRSPLPDLVLLALTDATGLARWQASRATASDAPSLARVPTIVIVGTGQEDLAEQALRLGAQDYLTAGTITPLALRTCVARALAHQQLTQRLAQWELASQSSAAEPDGGDRGHPADALLQHLYDAVVATDPQGIIQTWNHGAEVTFGYPAAVAIGQSITMLHNDPRAMVSLALTPALTQGRYAIEIPCRHQDGRPLHLDWYLSACRDAAGNLTGVLGVARDITRHQQAALEARQLQQRLDFLLNTSPAVTYSAQPDSLFACTFISRNVRQVLGYTPDEVMATPDFWMRHVHPEDVPKILDAMGHLFEQGWLQLEYRFRHRNGHPVWLQDELVLLRDEAGQPVEIVGYFTDISDRKQAEVDRHNLADRLSLALQSVALGTWEWDLINEAFWDERTCAIYGLQGLDRPVTYADWRACVHPEDLAWVEAALQTAAQGGEQFNVEFRIYRHSDHALRWVQGIALLQRDGQGQPTRMVGINCDISDRKAAENALKESQQLLQTILDTVPIPIFWKDQQSVYRGANAIAAQVLGLMCPEDCIGYTDDHLPWEPELAQMFQREDQVIMATGQSRLHQIHHVWLKNGLELWLDLSKVPLRNAAGDIIGVLGTAQDITDRKQAEIERQNLSDRLSLAVQAGAIGIWHWDLADDLFWDEQICRIYGLTVADQSTPWQVWLDQVHQEDRDRVEGLLQAAIEGAPYTGVEFRIWRTDGALRWIQSFALVQRDENGQPIGMVGINQDITDRKQAELELQRTNQELAHATRMKDEFLATMSHELRTPLNAILGMTENLQEAVFGPINASQHAALDTIDRSAAHLLALINDILDVAKIESGHLQLDLVPTEVASLCQASLSFIRQQARHKNLQLISHIPDDLPAVEVDQRRIQQVLINLLNNAVKFTPAGGQITLAVTLDASTAAPVLRWTVTDTGIGIAPDQIACLFRPFIQVDSALNRQYEGTGLGLALVKRLVELHGGTVSVTSEVDVGSCFAFTLPVPLLAAAVITPSDTHVAAETERSPATPTVRSPRILLAEDNADNIETFTAYLEAKGFDLQVAQDGEAAIALAVADPPDLILMDIQMPKMDGLEAIRRLRMLPLLAQVPIIALTAFAMSQDRDRCLVAGANDYLSKPVNLKHLIQVIHSWLTPTTETASTLYD